MRYGDAAVRICPTLGFLEMPTAIIAAYTPRGFFIAADGTSRREDHGVYTVLTEDEQKVFRIVDERACFGFAVSGTALFTPDDDDADIIFDFRLEIPKAANALRTTVCSDAMDYCRRLAESVNEQLNRSVLRARQAGKQVSYPSDQGQFGDGTIALLFLFGFYSGMPCGVIIRFFHRSQQLASPETVRRFVENDQGISGSDAVSHLLYESNDPRFAQFRFPFTPRNATFEEWSRLAKNYVAACASEHGRAADPEITLGIGGYVHSAKITRRGGFEWIDRPRNLATD